jgi:hypothetical protein
MNQKKRLEQLAQKPVPVPKTEPPETPIRKQLKTVDRISYQIGSN